MNNLEEKIQKEKTSLGKKINCSIEILSPLHIGSGIKLQKNFDFLSEKDYTIIFSEEEIEKLLVENPELIEEFNKPDFNPSFYLKKISNPRRYNVKCFAREILEFERNGEGKPYIPGTSLKGAIRTVLLNFFFNSKSQEEKKKLYSKINYMSKFASDPILKDLFGEDSNHNLFRTISVNDIYFADNSLNLLSTYVLSLSSENSYKWKKMGKNNLNSDNYKEATAIYSEMINTGSKANFTVRLDDFLFTNKIAKAELKFDQLTINELAKIINEYSKTQIQNEINFFDRLNSNNKLDTLLNNIKDIENKITLNNKSEFIIRLSWGSGWKGMTGDFLNPEILKEVRSKLRLGKFGFNVFPKSRKIVFEGSKPAFLSGWVKVKFNMNYTNDEITDSYIDYRKNSESPVKENHFLEPTKIAEKPKVSNQKDFISAEIIDDKSKPPKVKILDGGFKDMELDMPMGNLFNLGLTKGSQVLVEFQYDKKKKPMKAIFKGKK